MQAEHHSFSRTVLCRMRCDNCRKVIRFLGVRCQDCRLKYHKKCSSYLTTEYEQRCQKVDTERTKVRRFWRKSHNTCGKWSLQSKNSENIGANGVQRTLASLNARRKIRQKLINGLYESFCYGPHQALEFKPSSPVQVRPSAPLEITVERHGSLEKYPTSVCENLTTIDKPLFGSPTSACNDNFLSSSPWHRASSWTTWASSGTYSSGYSSANTSCPSSANSHRSTSPTPDFSNLKLLDETSEQYSNAESDLSDDGVYSGSDEGHDSAGDISFSTNDFFGTWPQKNRARGRQEINKRTLSADDCHGVRQRDSTGTASNRGGKENEEEMKKSLREWNIPYSDLQFGEIVGVSPKGNVYKGRWHGEIMIHTRRKSSRDDVEEFLKEVSVLSMIRHENVVLFMGACLEPPKLAVITSFRRGLSLHNHLHVRQDAFSLQSKISIARQIAQGMSYLHAKGIVLPALTTMNVFLESKVKLCVSGYCNKTARVEREGYASVPQGHLTYLAPELMRTLTRRGFQLSPEERYTECSNIYAYSTILYELFTGKWPFILLPTHCIIWMIGKGKHQGLTHIQCPEQLRDLIEGCWSSERTYRPSFYSIAEFLQQQNVPPEVRRKRISLSEPEKINCVGRKMNTLSIR